MDNICERCTGCGLCVVSCPKKAITLEINDKGFYVAKINKEKCINCNLCQKICIRNNISGIDICEGTLWAGSSKDSLTISSTTSGGIAYEIAKWAIENNYLVVGTVYDYSKNIAKMKVIDNEKELEKIKGSKYIQSKPDEAMQNLYLLLKNNPKKKAVVFGMPCQIAGYNKFFQTKKISNEIYYVDLFCHGVPSYLVWQKYIAEFKSIHKGEKIEKIEFRNKKNKWHNYTLYIKTDKKDYYFKSERDNFYKAFFDNVLLNNTCYDCIYRKKISNADIRLGDFWGKKYVSNLEGVSAILTLTENGTKIIESISNRIKISKEEKLDEFITYQSTKDYNIMNSEYYLDFLRFNTLKETIKMYRKTMPKKYIIKQNAKQIISYFPNGLKNKIRVVSSSIVRR